MARELTMPKLSDSMADAVITRWLKSPGESFARGDALIEVETDKATVVYEAEWDGMLAAILVPEGGTAGVGEAIATLSSGDGEASDEATPSPPGRDARALAGARSRTRRRTLACRRRRRLAPERHAGREASRRSSSASRSTASPERGPGAG